MIERFRKRPVPTDQPTTDRPAELPAWDSIARPEVMPEVRGEDMLLQWNAASALRTEGRLEEALDLAFECTEAARSFGWKRISSSWAWDTAVLARKIGRLDVEVAVLSGYIQAHALESAAARRFPARLEVAQALMRTAD